MAEKLQRRSRCYANMTRKARRFIKRQQAHQDRAAARMDPEGAPTRRAYNGWAD